MRGLAPDAELSKSRAVANFYDRIGWVHDGVAYRDTRMWEDLRPFAKAYQARCRRRLSAHFTGGDLLLDLGSGPVQHEEYHLIHDKYRTVALLDISETALRNAPRADRYAPVLADACRLPLASDSCAAIFSSNVVNHIAPEHQRIAVDEMLRVLRPGGKALLVLYNPRRWSRKARRPARASNQDAANLFHHAVDVSWWRQFDDRAEVSARSHRFLFISTLRAIPANRFGTLVLNLVSVLERVLAYPIAPWVAYYSVALIKRDRR